jgi:tripartite-type tricarboxylate transporter receptor subunit TctC
VIVENKPGAGGNIGADFVAKSPADGYTILVAQNGLTMIPWLEKSLPFDPMGFAPVTIALTLPMGAAVNLELPVKSINELIAYAKANPGKLSYATPGIGTPHHLAVEWFMDLTGTKMVMVPYKGASQMLPDLIGGRVNVLFGALNSMLPHIQSGKIRAIGVGELKRLAMMPDVPAVAESVPGYEVPFWFGFAAPQGTPAAITAKLAEETRIIVNMPDVSSRLKQSGFEIAGTTPEQMRTQMQREYDLWGKVIKKAGIKVE